MRELNLDQLRTLVAITDLGTFSKAVCWGAILPSAPV